MSKPVDLPNDVEALKALLVASVDRNLRKQDRIDQVEKLVADFRRALFGHGHGWLTRSNLSCHLKI